MKATALLDKMAMNGAWMTESYDRIRQDYLNEFIAVKDRMVISHNKSLDLLLAELRSKKEQLDEILIEFVHGDDFKFIL